MLSDMKDTISKVQALVTETKGEAWATAFAEVRRTSMVFGLR